MESLKKYCNLPGTSILESVIALCIISACLYIAVLVYANVFSDRTSPAFYLTRNKVDELYFLSQVRGDSLRDALDAKFEIDEEWQNSHLKKIRIVLTDSINPVAQEFFIQSYD